MNEKDHTESLKIERSQGCPLTIPIGFEQNYVFCGSVPYIAGCNWRCGVTSGPAQCVSGRLLSTVVFESIDHVYSRAEKSQK
jgi:hypothetical protein